MWYIIMKEFCCKVSSTWSNDDRTKDVAFTHRTHSYGGPEKVSQLDFIIGPKERHDDCYFCNEGTLWDSWDHYPIYGRIQEGGWEPKTVEYKIGRKFDSNTKTIEFRRRLCGTLHHQTHRNTMPCNTTVDTRETSICESSGHEDQHCRSLHETSEWIANTLAREETWTSNLGWYDMLQMVTTEEW